MNDADFMRYSRQILLEDIAVEGQSRLQRGRALIIGLGGLGSPAAHYLAGAGVGTLTLVDDDQVHIAACVAQNRPLISASAVGFGGQIMTLTPPWQHGCYRCLWPDDAEPERNCRTAGVPGPVVGMMGTLQALEALKLLSGMPTDASTLRLFDGRSGQWRTLSLTRAPGCPVCGGAYARSA